MALKTAKVPTPLVPTFERADEHVRRYFDQKSEDPARGSITIGADRYILVRATSLSVCFIDIIKKLFPDQSSREGIEGILKTLFQVAHGIGKADAEAFHKTLGIEDPVDKLAVGPIHFAHAGWALVDIHADSRPTADDDFYLLYDHPNSFEADSWRKEGWTTDFCACFMNAGYSSGWCEQSFGLELTSREMLCRAKGDDYCRFIMAPPDRVDAHVEQYREKNAELFIPASQRMPP